MLRQALKVFSTFNPPPLASLPSDPRPNQLHGLPTELLQYIASMFLPLSSAASLALSSRFILTKLGTDYFTQLKKASPLPPVTRCITYELLSHMFERSSSIVSLIKSLRI